MMFKQRFTKMLLIGSVLAAVLGAGVLVACGGDSEAGNGHDSDRSEASEVSSGREGPGEHGGRGEGGPEGRNEGGSEGRGEGGSEGAGGEGHGPEGEGGSESNEAAMSSPIIPLGQSWEGNLGGLAVSARFEEGTGTVYTTVQNTTSEKLCYVQSEPHMKMGTRTVGELGPDKLGDLNPGEQATSVLAVADEPGMAGVAYDGYVVHMEVFDCSGPGPVPHSGEGAEGGGEGSEGGGESGGEHGSGGEGSAEGGAEGSEAGGEEGSGALLALDETFDTVRGGARLIMSYDASTNAFTGTVENTTNSVLTRVRIEVHLSNGVELGPTTPVDMAPGEVRTVNLPATAAPFTGWVPHAEVGSSEGGGESGGEHSSGGGGNEAGGEHGSGGDGNEAGGEHGSGGERRGGG